jgi:elongation factor G
MIDPFAGKISFIRVFSGVLPGESDWHDITTGNKQKIGHVLAVNGKKHTTIHRATAGDIVAVTKIDEFDTNHTIASDSIPITIPPTKYPQPPIHMALKAADKNEEDKVGTALPKIIAGDPTVHVERSQETLETVIHAAGGMQVDMIAYRLKKPIQVKC